MSALFSIAWRRVRPWPSQANQAVVVLVSGRLGGASRASRQQRPAYSTTPTREDIRVPCRSNGSVTLNVHRASAPSDPSRIVLLYFPAAHGLFSPGSSDRQLAPDPDDFAVHHLLASTQGTVVRVNYRAGHGVAYPTPVHDVLAAYDWVVAELAPSLASGSLSRHPHHRHVKLGVCGQLLGGSLAAMLALTECRMGSDRVAAAAVNNPIGEWVFPSDLVQSEGQRSSSGATSRASLAAAASAPLRRTKKTVPGSWDRNLANPTLPADAVIEARSRLLQKPSQWFDPFASPILFFRSAGLGTLLPGELLADTGRDESTTSNPTPEPHPGLDELSPHQDRYNYETTMLDDALNDPTPHPQTTSAPGHHSHANAPLVPRRRAHRIYPPHGSALRLPSTRISTSPTSPLHDQALELAKLMRRSVARSALRSHALVHPDVEVPEGDAARADAARLAESRVELDVLPRGAGGHGGGGDADDDDVGLWGPSAEGERRLREVGAWFRKKLG